MIKKHTFLKMFFKNIQCFFCSEKKCNVKSFPNKEKIEKIYSGCDTKMIVYRCKKEVIRKQKKEK